MKHQHYTEFLIEEKTLRSSRNPSYSARAFARTIGLSPGFLNLLLQRKRALSLDRAKKIVLKLNWSSEAKYGFLEMVREQSQDETVPPPSKVFSALFSPRTKLYSGKGALTRLDGGMKIRFSILIRLGRVDESSGNQIFTRYEYETGEAYDLDFRLHDSGKGTFLVHMNGQKIGDGFFVGKICHVDVNLTHPEIGPLHSSISYVFTGKQVSASGRNFVTNTTFEQVATAVRPAPK